jgi:peptidoglycan/LPS O-acetylase OafA/YrhL
VHWLCIATYAPVIAYNYETIAKDYYFWQNASGEKHLWFGWILNPFFLSSWIFSPLHYWNSVAWSVSTQVGFYFMFPFIARAMKKRLAREEGGLAVSVSASVRRLPTKLARRRKPRAR